MKLKSIAGSILFAANLFLLLLLVFGNRIAEPAWLQVIGRMHPLLLHFPIVILLMAFLWEWLPLRADPAHRSLYQSVDTLLLLTGSLTAVITAIMGMLLSLQGGYEGHTVQWHKWTGVAIAFLSYGYYNYRQMQPAFTLVNKISGPLIAVCLVVAGHFGAGITHGSGFLWQPIEASRKKAPVPFEKAVVFDDLVKPVLEAKCMSCHNRDKAKGRLVMETAKRLLKGGKHGKLFVAGKPELSLLLKRIHLPLEDDDHMPPEGKPALTDAEMDLLYWWIKSGAPMDQKVAALPAKDSLRILAMDFLKPPHEAPESYDFAAADEKQVQQLSNNYRVITPLAEGSPALSVDFYNKNAYTPKSVEELKPLEEQIVSLNLSKMPVKDADLKVISRFPNLRTLNLNFTDITGKGLKALDGLKHLHSLSVSGTKVDYASMARLKTLPALKEVYAWSTALKEADVARLRKQLEKISFETGYRDTAHQVLPLSPPLVTQAGIFSDSVQIQLRHVVSGVHIRYTLDGTEPDSLQSPVYKTPFVIRENTVLKARAFKTGWRGSNPVRAQYLKSAYRPDSIILLSAPDGQYSGKGGLVLADKELGDMNYGNGQWVGYHGGDMQVLLLFHEPVTLHTVALNFLDHIPRAIFPPSLVEVWGGTDRDHMKLMGKTSPVMPDKDTPPAPLLVTTEADGAVRCIRIVARPLKQLPAWHAAKGQPAWLLASEVLLN
ncbi:chitobiase/beta-hexosaminidase C-terminal domain-containing protein [Compostibacter hankyongensis]|uniref:Chitobiase/beta-hexosaminidase C-terminal domain-containing protein n=1 Tax=Compostibacter hankyongensis TaxID=1007089 RepID=A0ABP8G116_9BACT